MKTKTLFTLLFSLALSFIFGSAVAQGLGTDPMATTFVCVGISSVISFMPLPMGVSFQVALNQMIETELLKAFRHENRWLERIQSKNNYVNNNIINITEIGADPDVLIDNTVYPIDTAGRTDDSNPVALKKFETENTKITDDELYALGYDKVSSVRTQHIEKLEEFTGQHGLHSIAPQADGVLTPVLETTGAVVSGRSRLTSADIVNLKERYTAAKIPLANRVLVLCSEHVSDLLLEDRSLSDRYHNHKGGLISENYYGFAIYEDIYSPIYAGDNTKKAFGAAAAPLTDRNASVAFYAPRAFKATGSVISYLSEAKSNPTMRETVFGTRLYHIVLPKKWEGFGAIVSKRA